MPVQFVSVDSEDLSDLLADMERAYGVQPAKDAFKDCATLGDALTRLWSLIPENLRQSGSCATSIAFWALRLQLKNRKLRPDALLENIRDFHYASLQNALHKHKWRTPPRRVHPATWLLTLVAALISVFWLTPVIHAGIVFALPVITFIIGKILHDHAFRSEGPVGIETLGGLAQAVARENLGRLTNTNSRPAYRDLLGFARYHLKDEKLVWDSPIV